MLRFDDKIIEDAPQSVRNTIGSYIDKIMNHGKAASVDAKAAQLFTVKEDKLVELAGDYNEYHARIKSSLKKSARRLGRHLPLQSISGV